MVNKAISKDIRDRVIWLVEHGYAPPDIGEIFGISDRTLRRWRRNNDTYGTPLPPPPLQRGRPHTLNNDMTHDLYTLLKEAPDMYLDEIQDWLAVAHDVRLSKTALFENIRDAGVTYKLLRKAAAERDEDARAEWMDDMNTHYTAQQLVFVDETSKDDRTIYRHYGRAPSGMHAESVILWWIWGNKGASGEGQNLLSGPSESSDIKDKGKIELLYSFVWYSG